MLCKDLGCGHAFTNTHHNMEGKVTILAMYLTKHTTNLTDSVIVENEDMDPYAGIYFRPACSNKPAVVVCSGKGFFEEICTLHVEYVHLFYKSF